MTVSPFAYKVRNYAVRSLFKALGAHPSSAPYVTGDGFRAMARRRLEQGDRLDGRRVAAGDIVFVKSDELPRFRDEVLPDIRERFVLVSHNSDWTIDERYVDIADNPKVVRWFAENAVLRHEKIQALPIGLENRRLWNNGIVSDFDRLRPASGDRKMRILYAFSVGTNRKEREPALEALRSHPLADGPAWTDSRRYRNTVVDYAFLASPPGNGFDCHRTWEALYLGAIPIVKRSNFFDAFPGLPAIQVDDWREIQGWDEDFLRRSFEELSPRIADCPYLRLDYWARRLEECRGRIHDGLG